LIETDKRNIYSVRNNEKILVEKEKSMFEIFAKEIMILEVLERDENEYNEDEVMKPKSEESKLILFNSEKFGEKEGIEILSEDMRIKHNFKFI
jgi:hypothetical protein